MTQSLQSPLIIVVFLLASSTLDAAPLPVQFKFDAEDQTWRARWNGDLAAISDLPQALAPGEAIFIHADTALDMQPPEPILQIRYCHQDHLGSSACLTDELGNLVEATVNYPFGHPRDQFSPRAPPESYQFTQKERDQESGLHYFEARFFAPGLSRFISLDPLAPDLKSKWLQMPQYLHLYDYGINKPLRFIDPDGKGPKVVVEGDTVHVTLKVYFTGNRRYR